MPLSWPERGYEGWFCGSTNQVSTRARCRDGDLQLPSWGDMGGGGEQCRLLGLPRGGLNFLVKKAGREVAFPLLSRGEAPAGCIGGMGAVWGVRRKYFCSVAGGQLPQFSLMPHECLWWLISHHPGSNTGCGTLVEVPAVSFTRTTSAYVSLGSM